MRPSWWKELLGWVILPFLAIPLVLSSWSGAIVAAYASWASMFLIYSLQDKVTALFWIALYLAIANSGLMYLKSWMAKKNGYDVGDIGSVPVGWEPIWEWVSLVAKVAGIGLFVYGIAIKLSDKTL